VRPRLEGSHENDVGTAMHPVNETVQEVAESRGIRQGDVVREQHRHEIGSNFVKEGERITRRRPTEISEEISGAAEVVHHRTRRFRPSAEDTHARDWGEEGRTPSNPGIRSRLATGWATVSLCSLLSPTAVVVGLFSQPRSSMRYCQAPAPGMSNQ